jgi:PAS domain S-box-containing protein
LNRQDTSDVPAMLLPHTPDFQQVFEKSPDACLVAVPDADFTLVAVSDAYLHATGKAREGILGRPFFEVFTQSSLHASFERVMATRAADTVTVHLEERYWSLTTTPVLSSQGEVLYLIHRMEDVTELREAYAAAEQVALHAAILQAILQAIPDALYVGDATGIKLVNATALEMLGFRSLEELNQNIATLGERLQNRSVEDGHRLAVEEEPFMRALHGEPVVQEVRSRHLVTGKDVVVRCAASPIRLGESIIGAVAVNTDHTGLKCAEQKLRQTAEFRERLLGIVSHDLRNPLNAILLSAHALLNSGCVPPHHLKCVHRIVTSAKRMERMIADLLDFTRGRLGSGLPMTPRPANLRHICQHVLEELGAGNPQRELRLSARGDCQGEWDPDRLAQLLGNLGKNALDYSPEESPVDFVLRDEGDTVCLEVHNGGPPIPEDQLPHIFDPFRRAHRGSHSGLGLGLYIVDQIARAHGGRVTVRSTGAEGTTFSVRLPRATPSLQS